MRNRAPPVQLFHNWDRWMKTSCFQPNAKFTVTRNKWKRLGCGVNKSQCQGQSVDNLLKPYPWGMNRSQWTLLNFQTCFGCPSWIELFCLFGFHQNARDLNGPSGLQPWTPSPSKLMEKGLIYQCCSALLKTSQCPQYQFHFGSRNWCEVIYNANYLPREKAVL